MKSLRGSQDISQYEESIIYRLTAVMSDEDQSSFNFCNLRISILYISSFELRRFAIANPMKAFNCWFTKIHLSRHRTTILPLDIRLLKLLLRLVWSKSKQLQANFTNWLFVFTPVVNQVNESINSPSQIITYISLPLSALVGNCYLPLKVNH